MSITDELRDWVTDHYSGWKSKQAEGIAIADRIDAEHERECKEQYACGVEHGIGASIDASMIQTHGYVELPKDADGVPIHLGDKVYQVKGGWVYTVKSISFYPNNTTVTFECEHGFGSDSAHSVRHYHEPTVEDVLREMLYKAHIYDEREMELLPDLIADYAKRLTLAEGEDA